MSPSGLIVIFAHERLSPRESAAVQRITPFQRPSETLSLHFGFVEFQTVR